MAEALVPMKRESPSAGTLVECLTVVVTFNVIGIPPKFCVICIDIRRVKLAIFGRGWTQCRLRCTRSRIKGVNAYPISF